jgi:hypothetical protein
MNNRLPDAVDRHQFATVTPSAVRDLRAVSASSSANALTTATKQCHRKSRNAAFSGAVRRSTITAFRMQQAMPAYRTIYDSVKQALDPNNVIAPGRYGIHP